LQGYDDIPKEIPDPDAKKVHILLIPLYFYGTYSLVYTSCDQIFSRSLISHSSLPAAARGLG
jgi:hypothetical protein